MKVRVQGSFHGFSKDGNISLVNQSYARLPSVEEKSKRSNSLRLATEVDARLSKSTF